MRNKEASSGSPTFMEIWIRVCTTCGDTIPASEFKNHRAVMIMKRDYCGACADRITRRKETSHAAAFPAFRNHPRLAAAVVLTVVLLALFFALRAGRPPL